VRVGEEHAGADLRGALLVLGEFLVLIPRRCPMQPGGESGNANAMLTACWTVCAVETAAGRCSRITNRVVRSTRAPIPVLFPGPMIRSPSHCPACTRSSTATGRSAIIRIAVNHPAADRRAPAAADVDATAPGGSGQPHHYRSSRRTPIETADWRIGCGARARPALVPTLDVGLHVSR
jgi:hypothetical protein